MSKGSIEEFLCRHHNEDVHTEHVARLAVGMFEQCHQGLGIDAAEREIIEASARLHNVGYAEADEQWPERGAELVAQDRVRGFSGRDRRLLAAVVMLQDPDVDRVLRHPLVAELADRDRALRGAAFVRIADGLDHGHLQDAKLKDLRIEGGQARLRVGGLRYAGNLDAARSKADVWRRVFAMDIDVRGRIKSTGARYEGIARPTDSVLEAVRRMLNVEYRIMADNVPGMRDGESTDPLHDFRVALRRFRAVLRQFRRPLEATSAQELNRRLSVLGDELSHARDVDATWEFLTQPKIAGRFEGDSNWPAYLDELRDARRRALPEVQRILDAPALADLMRRLRRLLRVELPDAQRVGGSPGVAEFARKQVQRMRKRLQLTADPDREAHPEELHELRRLCRRYRYWSESLAPVLGGPVRDYATEFKALSDALGGLNDMNVYLRRLDEYPPAVLPEGLPGLLASRREECWGEFQVHWNQVRRKKLRQEIKGL